MTTLPSLLVLTDRRVSAAAGRCLTATVEAALDGGAPAVLLREKDLSPARRLAVGESVAAVVRAAGALLLVASDLDLARHLDADGVHLAAGDPGPTGPAGSRLVGRSCHDALDVGGAVAEGMDHVTVSPVHPTTSKPGYGPPLGTAGLSTLVAVAAPTPVYALGGVTPAATPACLAAGASGIAVMGGVMGAPDPARTVASLLEHLDVEETIP